MKIIVSFTCKAGRKRIGIIYTLYVIVGGVAQWYNVGLWPANFPCPALDLQLMGDH